MLKIFVLIMITMISTKAQNVSHIKRAYSNWITNFDKTAVDFNEIRSGGPPKDGIPAIFNPNFVTTSQASNWLKDNEPVISLEMRGEFKAYPLQILIWHEIVNDEIGGTPVIITFCPLCYSAIVFDRRIKNETHRFGVSGLLRNSDMIMYDQKTESFWQQFTGEAIVGDMLGEKLEIIPSQIISFAQFQEAYPSGKVLSKETGYNRRYGINPYVGYDDVDQTPFLFDGPKDGRLKPNEKVIAIQKDGIAKAYPYKITQIKRVINDKIGDQSIVVFHAKGAASVLDANKISSSKESGSTGIFDPVIDGRLHKFSYSKGFFYDDQTDSKWDVTGRAIEGKLEGTKLKRIAHGDYFAFAWLAFRPETEIYKN